MDSDALLHMLIFRLLHDVGGIAFGIVTVLAIVCLILSIMRSRFAPFAAGDPSYFAASFFPALASLSAVIGHLAYDVIDGAYAFGGLFSPEVLLLIAGVDLAIVSTASAITLLFLFLGIVSKWHTRSGCHSILIGGHNK